MLFLKAFWQERRTYFGVKEFTIVLTESHIELYRAYLKNNIKFSLIDMFGEVETNITKCLPGKVDCRCLTLIIK